MNPYRSYQGMDEDNFLDKDLMMAEGGEDYTSDDDSDVSYSLNSDPDETSDDDDFEGQLQFQSDDGKSDNEDESLEEREPCLDLADNEAEGPLGTGDRTEEKDKKRRHNISMWNYFISGDFYGQRVTPLYINILTDFVDAEIFMIDGDSLLFELLGEASLDWSNGGQFLHLTYLLERFLQYFTDKGGVFHIVFFKDMEILWSSHPSMLVARQSLILHLEHNTNFTVITSIDNFWGEQWKTYIKDKIPAFLLLTDAESVPFKTTKKKQLCLEFFFRSFLFHSLGQELNCVFISGIEMTATKVMGFYTQSTSHHNWLFRKYMEPVRETWKVLMSYWRREASENEHGCSGDCSSSQIDVKEKIKTALKSPRQGGCRGLATMLACEMILYKVINEPNFNEKRMKATEDRIKLFLLHSLLLNTLPLKYRAQTINANLLDQYCKEKDGHIYPFQEIHKCLWKILKVIHDDYPAMKDAASVSLDMSSVADIMDGRLVHALFSLAVDQSSMDIEAFSLPEDVLKEAKSAWSEIVAAVNTTRHPDLSQAHFAPNFAGCVAGFPGKEDEDGVEWETCVKLKKLLDVDNVLVNEYAGDIRSNINAMAVEESVEEELFNIGREFDELYHWHSLKPLSDDYDRTKETITEKLPDDPRLRKKRLIENQKFARYHRLYGDSLSSDIGLAKTIIVTNTNAEKKKGKKKEGKVSQKAKQIIEANEQKRREEEQGKDQEKWKHIEKSLRSENYSNALQLVDEFLTKCKSPDFSFQALMKKAQTCLDAWQDTRSRYPKSNEMKYPVLLMECVRKMYHEFSIHLTRKDKKKLAGYMQKLGFDDISVIFYDLKPDTENKARQLSVHTTSARFQLEFMGHLLKREERADRDPRVDHFIPDTWQRELLDAVDNNESAVIVAPTSSGKTYASYYCMEKVLRESNEGVVVYVSPTKALVNQVAATIYAQFRNKQLPEGRSVYGVFTRDYQYKTLNSQILITVPQCLEIFFLSPRRQEWTKNIKYVIFDEVHCLGQEIGAEVWEHLLLLIRCPFLALSATIGNPSDLLEWLQAAQDFRQKQDGQDKGKLRKSYRVRLVTCEERYSDLEKSIYLPKRVASSDEEISKERRKCEGNNVSSTENFVSLHPCAQLATKQLRENGFPGDMALTPRETLQLYDAIVQHWPDKESLQGLSPEKYFQENIFIGKRHARQYEEELKKELKSWADEENNLQKVESVIQSLNSVPSEEMTTMPSGDPFILKNFPTLVEQLKAQDKLPALVFSFNRVFCERLAQTLVRKFEKKEEEIRAITRKLDERKRLQVEKKEKRNRDKTEKEKAKRSSTKREKLEETQDEQPEFSDLDEPLKECTLSSVNVIGKEKLKKILYRIWMINSKNIFKRALKRGISYHHAGLNNKMRMVVEMLFREKYLQVVTATGTLSLGIHMPCKTVVFAGDSPFLNSLMYRQMSGRAGRRGFDPVGNVVFFGVPYQKVQRLITANIPKLVGNFPINVSLVLRLLLMTSKGEDKRDAFTKSITLLSHPFICRKHPQMEGQIKKHFLFSVELLARLSLINKDTGVPQEMAGLATHLHYHEPSNFVLISFLQRGLFHKLCKPGKKGKFPEDVMRTMVLVLSHLFGRVYLHANYKRRIHLCPTSKVILENLPREFAEALRSYNEQVTNVFRQYLTSVAAEHEREQGEENKLPISGIEFQDQASVNVIDEFGTIKNLGRSATGYFACSSFTALSGNSDLQLPSGQEDEVEEDSEGSEEDEDADSRESSGSGEESEEDEEEFQREPIDHLLKIIRQDVYTDMDVVPILRVERIRRLNAYALDFFKHGSAIVIERENRIQAGEVFHKLKDFCLTIKSISCSLEELGTESDNVVRAFKQLAAEFGDKFNDQFGRDIIV
ncbi:probable ATP-dependent RNA helicase DDX60 isoform X5 [Montipora foliosa]|uniref:probable ATP-dependent RNA helicase DDX60 isoform X5 n=2 Tax=Montipora foliosa TaxID=591990 RepID=UPI0035F173D9